MKAQYILTDAEVHNINTILIHMHNSIEDARYDGGYSVYKEAIDKLDRNVSSLSDLLKVS